LPEELLASVEGF